jgi:putative transposase
MPRPRRIDYEGAVYHVTSRGNERRAIFRDDSDRWMFLRILGEVVDHCDVVCHAWVLMDNHYHLMLETPVANLSLAMKHLNGIYTQKFNKKHHRTGHLFQGRFKAMVVERDTYLKTLCRYVVLNPVRARMVKGPRDWKWSSYRATAGWEKAEPWLETDWIIGQFGRNRKRAQKAYRAYIEEGLKIKKSVWEDLYSGIYLGGRDFLDRAHEIGQRHKDLDMPKFQKQVVLQKPEEVIREVSKAYGEKAEILSEWKRGSEARDVAIYLLKRKSGMSLKEIGKKIGIGATGVGNRWRRVKNRILKDEAFAKKLRKWIVVA